MASVGRLLLNDWQIHSVVQGSSGNAVFQINTAGYKIAFVSKLWQSGTVTKLGLRIGTLTTAQTCRLSLQTVDASGMPTGTGYGGSSTTDTFTPAANTFGEVTLTTPAAATLGDTVAIVLEFDSTAGDLFATAWTGGTSLGWNFPYMAKYSGSWSKPNFACMYAAYIGYGDGTYPAIDMVPSNGFASNVSFNSGSSPNEYGIQFTATVPMRVAGIWHAFAINAGADYELRLYEATSTTPLGSIACDGDQTRNTQGNIIAMPLSSPVTLSAGTSYIASVLATASGANLSSRAWTVADAAHLQSLGFDPGQAVGLVTRSGSAWSAKTATTVPSIGLIIDQASDGAGGATGVPMTRVVSGV